MSDKVKKFGKKLSPAAPHDPTKSGIYMREDLEPRNNDQSRINRWLKLAEDYLNAGGNNSDGEFA